MPPATLMPRTMRADTELPKGPMSEQVRVALHLLKTVKAELQKERGERDQAGAKAVRRFRIPSIRVV